MKIRLLAEWLHNNYQELAELTGWEVQKKTKTKFKDLPKENRETMLLLAGRLLNLFKRKGFFMAKAIKIVSKVDFDDGWVGAGLTIKPKRKEDVIGLRIVKKDKVIYWLDVTSSEALAIISTLARTLEILK